MTNFTLTIVFFLSTFSIIPSSNDYLPDKSGSLSMMESELIITEIMYHPNSSDSSWEWIEIYNNGSETIDVSGYVLDDNNSTEQNSANIAMGLIAPGETAILFDADITLEEFTAVWGNVNAIPVTGWPGLNNGGDSIGIWDSFENYENDNVSQLNVIEQVVYEDRNGWVDSNASSSIYLIDLSLDNTLASSWALSTVGEANAFGSNELHGNTGGDIGSPGLTPEIEDNEPPVIECPEAVEINHDEGLCSSEVPLLLPSASDNVSTDISFTATRSDGLDVLDAFPVGNTIITWIAMDEAGNFSEACDQLVTVVEIELPVANTQNITVELDENGLATIAPQDLDDPDNPSFDNCVIVEYMASKTEFDCSDIGTPVPVEFSVLDVNGNTSTIAEVEVTVIDKIEPIITCNADIAVISVNGDAITLEEITPPVVADNCDLEPVLSFVRSDENDLNAPFEVGSTTIVWTVTDNSDNHTECTQTVVVSFTPSMENDIIAFTIPDQIGETEIDMESKTIGVLMPIGTDITDLNVQLEISESASISPDASQTTNFEEPVVYTVTAQDGSEEEWTVIVSVEEDIIPPTFDVNGNTEDFVTEVKVGDVYTVGVIHNIVDDNLTVSEILGADLVDTSEPGTMFLVEYRVSDGTNSTTIIETVQISESTQDILTVTGFTLVNAETNEDLFKLEEGMQIDVKDLPTLHLNVRANGTDDIESMRLSLGGNLTTARIENVVPYALYGDFPKGHYFGDDFTLGTYTVTATPYSQDNLSGEIGQLLSLNFELVDSCANFTISLVEKFDNSTCEGADGFAVVSAVGGTGPMEYYWSHDNELRRNSAVGLSGGVYTVSAIDANSCIAELTFELQDPELPEVSLSPFEPISVDSSAFQLVGGFPEGGTYSGQGVVDGKFDPSIGPGRYDIVYSFKDPRTACTKDAVQTIEVLATLLKIQNFILVDADTNEDIMELTDGLRIDINTLPTRNLNIKANATEDVESVLLEMNGTLSTLRTENVVPYALFGDFPVENYFGNVLEIGTYSVSAKSYSEDKLGGKLGTSLKVHFELYETDSSMSNSSVIRIFPNPAVAEISIHLGHNVQPHKIHVYDYLGRVITTYDNIYPDENGTMVLNISHIPAGLYYVKLHDRQGHYYQKQLIIEK